MLIGNLKQQKILRELADKNALSHGYLFFGPEGVGKKTIALHLAHYLEKKEWPESRMPEQILIDTLMIAPGVGGTIGIDAARGITSHLATTPLVGSSRIVIIDDAHAMTPEAQNVLLKVSEEMARSALIIYVTHDPDALLPTLVSRLQRYYFGPTAKNEMSDWLIKSLALIPHDAENIAKRAAGSPGIASRLIHDENFKTQLEAANRFRAAKESDLSAFLKTLTEPDDFDLGRFLNALAFLEAAHARENSIRGETWHILLALRANVERFNLNSKIQLRALHQAMQK